MASDFGALNASGLNAFGSAVTYQHGAGAAFTVTGILQRDTDESRHLD